MFLTRLLTADCSGRVQVDLLSGLQPSFHSIQVSSQTQTCLHTSFSSLLLSLSSTLFPSSPPSPKAKKKIQAGFSLTVEVSTLPLHSHPPFPASLHQPVLYQPWSFLLDMMRQYPTDHCCGRLRTKLNNPTP